MREHNDGLGGLRDVARSLNNNDELDARVEQTRADLADCTVEVLRHATELGESVKQLQGGTVTQLHREPRANLEPTEDELRYLIEVIPEIDMQQRPEANSILNKMMHALAIESGPGGRFGGDKVA